MSYRFVCSFLVAAVCGATLGAAPAQAATTGSARVTTAQKIEFNAGSGKANRVTLTRSGRTITVDDVVTIKPGKGCKRVGKDVTKVRCTTSKDPNWVRVLLRDRNDTVTNKTGLGMSAHGEAGNDTLVGGPRRDYLYGGDGNDKVHGNGGDDHVDGNDGADTLDGGDGDDGLDGGTGKDTLLGRAGEDNLWGGTGNDRIWGGYGWDTIWEDIDARRSGADLLSGGADTDALYYIRDEAVTIDADGVKGDDGSRGEKDTIAADVEILSGGSGNDRVTGTARNDVLYGNDGKDVIVGGGGDDVLDGENGRDRLDGGAGADRCVAGAGDTLTRCEHR